MTQEATQTETTGNPTGNPTGTPPDATPPTGTPPATVPGVAELTAQLSALLAQQSQKEPEGAATAPDSIPANADLNKFDLGTIDDPVLRNVGNILQNLSAGSGLDLNRAIGKAIEEGRVDLIDRRYIAEAGGAVAAQLTVLAEETVKLAAAKANEVTNSIYTRAGGEAQWNAAVAAFNKGANDSVRKVVAQMLDSRDPTTIEAASNLIIDFGKTSGVLPQHAGRIVPAGLNQNANALTREQFQAELRKLDPMARDFETKRGELFQRRQLGKNLGL